MDPEPVAVSLDELTFDWEDGQMPKDHEHDVNDNSQDLKDFIFETGQHESQNGNDDVADFSKTRLAPYLDTNQILVTNESDIIMNSSDTVDTDNVEVDVLPELITEGEKSPEICTELELDDLPTELELIVPPEDVMTVPPKEFQDDMPPTEFEVDVPPLLLFPSRRATDSDDSDSEFEVPDPPDRVQKVNFPSDVADGEGIITDSAVPTNKNVDEFSANTSAVGIDLNSVDSEQVSPDLLTPRGKVSADLSLLIGISKSEHTSSVTEEKSQIGLQNDENSDGVFSDPLPDLRIPETEVEPQVTHFYYKGDSKTEDDQNIRNISNSSQEGTAPNKQNVACGDTVEMEEEVKEQSAKPSIVTTAEDWEDVQIVEPGFATDKGGKGGAPVIDSKPLTTYADAMAQFETENYSDVKDDIKTSIDRRGWSALTHFLFGPPKLQKGLLPQRDLVFCIAATPLDNANEGHIRMLQTVYRCLTGAKFDCQRFGGQWEEIGFQGRDPATDLRGTGMLSLLHLLFFLRDPNVKDLSRDVYKLSLHPTQNFPFCIMGINISRICLQALREGVFNKECNRRQNVAGTMNDVYTALYLYLYKLWKKGKTIADSGFVLQEVENYCRKQSKNIFKDLEADLKARKTHGLFGDHLEGEPEFFSVCKEEQADSKTAAELY